MKIIKSILDRPSLIMLITVIIALIFSELNLYSLVIICAMFAISIIYTIYQKKWMRLALFILGIFIFFVLWFVYILFNDYNEEIKPKIEIADSKFYSNEIFKSSILKVTDDLKIISKLDTIVYMGIEDEYDAECLYTGSKKIIAALENNIISKKEFIKVPKLGEYPTKIITQDNFSLNELKSVFKKESEGHYIIHIAFDKSYKKLYYSAFYY